MRRVRVAPGVRRSQIWSKTASLTFRTFGVQTGSAGRTSERRSPLQQLESLEMQFRAYSEPYFAEHEAKKSSRQTRARLERAREEGIGLARRRSTDTGSSSRRSRRRESQKKSQEVFSPASRGRMLPRTLVQKPAPGHTTVSSDEPSVADGAGREQATRTPPSSRFEMSSDAPATSAR